MRLSPLHQRLLVAYQQYKLHGFSQQVFFRGIGKRLLLLIPITIVTTLALLFLNAQWAASLIVGVVVGSLIRDIAYARQAKQVWLLLAEIIDWDRVVAIQQTKMLPQPKGEEDTVLS